MKKATLFATALLTGVTMLASTMPAQAANVKVIKVCGNEATAVNCDSLTEYLNQCQSKGCSVFTLSCLPENLGCIIGAPDCNVPDCGSTETPDCNTPDCGSTDAPDCNTPDCGSTDAPDCNTPDCGSTETPDTSVPGNGSNETPDSSLPEEDAPAAPDVTLPGDSAPETGDTTAPGTDASGDEDQAYHAYVLRIVQLVNEERAKAGLNPVTLQKNITAAAQVRAVETETLFSHTRPNGTSFSTALKEAGVSYRGAGENIAWGQKTPEQVMEGWMNSSGHRANILNANFTSIGVGYYRNASGVNYWTQLFTY